MTTQVLIRGGCILTLGAKTPNFSRADLLIEDGEVAEVGPGLRARGAESVDATDTIVMPGFVDTHRHAWRSLFRNLGDGAPTQGAPAPAQRLSDHYRPDDVYAATLIALLGAAEAGITTVVDSSDVTSREDLAEAALQAHADAGLRTVFVHAPGPAWSDAPGAARRETLARLSGMAGPSTSIALGSQPLGPSDGDRLESDWALARDLGLSIHVHVRGSQGAGVIFEAAKRGLLAEDVTIAHCSGLDQEELDAIATAGAAVAMAPSSEMAGGLGSPPVQALIDRNIRVGLGVDEEGMAPGDMFAQMRATISVQHADVFGLKLAGKAGLPRLMSTRDVIRYATVEGARVAGLRGVTGSLEPGMQADVIVLRTDHPNIFPINDPIGAVVWGMDTSNLDRVIVGGRTVMQEGALHTDVQRARSLAAAARERVGTASGLSVGTARGAEA